MAFPRLNEDLDIVVKMDDEPNDVGGLSADAFKAVFDMAGNYIKDYLNNILLEFLEGEAGAQNIGISPVEGVNAGDVQRALEILKGQINDATAGAIPDGSITTEKLKEESVATSKLAEGAVTTEKIANCAVTDNKIVSVSVNKIDGMVVVSTDNITDFSVTERKLGGGSVTEPKLGVGAVTEPKLAKGAVTTDKIADNAITFEKLNNNAKPRAILSVIESTTWYQQAPDEEGRFWFAADVAVNDFDPAKQDVVVYAADDESYNWLAENAFYELSTSATGFTLLAKEMPEDALKIYYELKVRGN